MDWLGLAGDESDRLTLMDRLAGESSDPSSAVLLAGARVLLQATNEHRANDAQIVVARALGNVVGRQVVREGPSICPSARNLVLASTRGDIISDELRAIVSRPMHGDDPHAW